MASIVENITLNAGNNTIKYQYDSGNTGYINLDYIQFATPIAIPELLSPRDFDDRYTPIEQWNILNTSKQRRFNPC